VRKNAAEHANKLPSVLFIEYTYSLSLYTCVGCDAGTVWLANHAWLPFEVVDIAALH